MGTAEIHPWAAGVGTAQDGMGLMQGKALPGFGFVLGVPRSGARRHGVPQSKAHSRRGAGTHSTLGSAGSAGEQSTQVGQAPPIPQHQQ